MSEKKTVSISSTFLRCLFFATIISVVALVIIHGCSGSWGASGSYEETQRKIEQSGGGIGSSITWSMDEKVGSFNQTCIFHESHYYKAKDGVRWGDIFSDGISTVKFNAASSSAFEHMGVLLGMIAGLTFVFYLFSTLKLEVK